MLDLLSSSQVLGKAGEQSSAHTHPALRNTRALVCMFLAGPSYTVPESREVQEWAMNCAIMFKLQHNTGCEWASRARCPRWWSLKRLQPKLCLRIRFSSLNDTNTTIQCGLKHESKKQALRGDAVPLWVHRVHVSGLETGDSKGAVRARHRCVCALDKETRVMLLHTSRLKSIRDYTHRAVGMNPRHWKGKKIFL